MSLRVVTRGVLIGAVIVVATGLARTSRGQTPLPFAVLAPAAAIIATAAPVLLFRWVRPRGTMMMAITRRRLSRRSMRALAFEWVGIEHIARIMWLAAIAAEDTYFRVHGGFDWESIRAARAHNRQHEKRRGGSTITQQVAKNLFLWPARTWLRKMMEAYVTLLIEALWPKRRILEVYLNVAQLGDDVFGVGAAARRYFGKRPAEIAAHEAALLAAALPGPVKYRVDQPSHELRFRQSWVLAAMRRIGDERLEGL